MHFSAAFVLAALPFLAAAGPLAETAPRAEQAIPITKRALYRRADGTVNATLLRNNIKHTVAKIHRGFEAYEGNTGGVHPLASGTKNVTKRATGRDPLTDDQAQLWYGTISVGTPAEKYAVDFDSGSSDLFLPGPSCNTNCQGHTKYQPSSSSTAKSLGKSYELEYGDGSTVSGTQYQHTVTIAGLTATKQTLGASSTYSSGFASDQFPADGLLGLAFESISDYRANPPFQTLIAQGQVSAPVFGVKLAESGSELYLGGTNGALYTGDFTWAALTDVGFWQVTLGGLSANGKSFLRNSPAIVDTGTTQLVGDPDSVASVYRQMPGARDVGEGTYTVPCSFDTPVSLTFSGKTFEVDPAAFVIGEDPSVGCIGGIGYDPQLEGGTSSVRLAGPH